VCGGRLAFAVGVFQTRQRDVFGNSEIDAGAPSDQFVADVSF